MMEIDSNPITKPSKKGTILSAVFYALAVVLLITAFVSLVVCHQNISRQLEQGVPVQGNELATGICRTARPCRREDLRAGVPAHFCTPAR